MMTSMENHTVITIDPDYVPETFQQSVVYHQSSEALCWDITDIPEGYANANSLVRYNEDHSELSFIDIANPSSPFRFEENDFDIKVSYQSVGNLLNEIEDYMIPISEESTIFPIKERKWRLVSKKVRDLVNSFGLITRVSSPVDSSNIDLEKQEFSEEETVHLYSSSNW